MTDFSELTQFVGKAKAAGRMAHSNYFPNPHKFKTLISQGKVKAFNCDKADILSVEHPKYVELIYFAETDDALIKAVETLQSEFSKPLSVETISKVGVDCPVAPDAVLQRMTRTGHAELRPVPPFVRKAVMEDSAWLVGLFGSKFNPILERTPSDKELSVLIENGQIFIACHDDRPAGFVVGEPQGRSLHLRYWFVCPEMRGRGIGSALMAAFFAMLPESQRQYLWVFTDNGNAIERYMRYGFVADDLRDCISVFDKNNIKYERSDY